MDGEPYRLQLRIDPFPYDFLIEIKTNGTERAQRITWQCARKCGIDIVGFIRQVLYVEGEINSLDPIRYGRIQHDIRWHLQKIQAVSISIALVRNAESEHQATR